MDYLTLPTALEVGGRSYAIRYDFRAVIDVINILNSTEYQETEKYFCALKVFYVDFDSIPMRDYQEAQERCYEFISYGNADSSGPALMSWKQDLKYIIPPVSKTLGRDVRSFAYDPASNTGGLHWWTFLSAYMEMGDCLFSQILKIREKKSRGKPLDSSESEWYQRNRAMVDLHDSYTADEEKLLEEWM